MVVVLKILEQWYMVNNYSLLPWEKILSLQKKGEMYVPALWFAKVIPYQMLIINTSPRSPSLPWESPVKTNIPVEGKKLKQLVTKRYWIKDGNSSKHIDVENQNWQLICSTAKRKASCFPQLFSQLHKAANPIQCEYFNFSKADSQGSEE